MPVDFKDRLKKLDGTWKQAEGDQNKGFERHPLGKFKMVVVSAQIGESKNKENPRLQVVWDFRNISGPNINKHAYAWDSLEDERGLNVLKGRLIALGITPPDKLAAIPEALDKACDRKVLAEITKAPGKGDFQKLVILRRLAKKPAAADADEGDSDGGL